MKLKSFIVPLIAAIVCLAGCVKEKVYIEPVLEVPTTLNLKSSAGDQTIQIKATRAWRATISYEGNASDWLSVSPETDAASNNSQTVTFTVKENTGRNRVAKVKFTIGLEDATLAVTQEGPGGSADPVYFNDFDKAAAVKDGNNWPYLSQTDCWKNEKGTGISTISYVAGDTNKATVRNNTKSNGSGVNNIFFGKNAIFCVKDITLPAKSNFIVSFCGIRNVYDATEGQSIFDHAAFKVYVSADNKKWVSLDYAFAGGDPDNAWDVASSTFTLPEGTNKLSIYIPTPTEPSVYRLDDLTLDIAETAGTVIDFSKGEDIDVGGGDDPSHPGTPSGTGTKEDPYNPTAAIAKAKEVGQTVSTDYYYIKGYVSEITEITDATSYGNATFYVTDSKAADTDAFLCYRVKYFGGEKFPTTDALKVGDEVVVKAQLVNYKGNTPETQNAEMVTINGKGQGDDPSHPGTPSGTGTQADPFNATAAIKAAEAAGETASSEFYYIKGFVSDDPSIDTGTYGNANFHITDAKGGNTTPFYCFQVMYIDGVKFTSTDQLKKGDEVVVYAQVVNYKGNTPETNGKGTGKIISINGGSDPSKALTVSPLSITVSAASTSASFNVSSNVSWTATCDNPAFSLGQTSGTSNATVTVMFEANTGTEAKVANITVSTTEDVAVKSYTVVLTQKAPSSENGYTKISSVDEVTDGSYVIVGSSNGKFFAMSNKNEGLYATSYLNPHEITVSDDVISASDGEAYAVTITKKGSNYVIKGEKFISYTGKNDTYFAFSDTEPSDAWTLTLGDYGFVFVATNDTTRGIVYRFGATHRFAPYKLTNVKGTEYTGVQLYKLQN